MNCYSPLFSAEELNFYCFNCSEINHLATDKQSLWLMKKNNHDIISFGCIQKTKKSSKCRFAHCLDAVLKFLKDYAHSVVLPTLNSASLDRIDFITRMLIEQPGCNFTVSCWINQNGVWLKIQFL